MAKPIPIPKRLKELRIEANMSQKELGIRAEIDEFTASARMNQYEKGIHVPDYGMVQRWGKILGVPTCYFYTEDDTMAKSIRALGQLSTKELKKVAATLND